MNSFLITASDNLQGAGKGLSIDRSPFAQGHYLAFSQQLFDSIDSHLITGTLQLVTRLPLKQAYLASPIQASSPMDSDCGEQSAESFHLTDSGRPAMAISVSLRQILKRQDEPQFTLLGFQLSQFPKARPKQVAWSIVRPRLPPKKRCVLI